MRVTVDRDQCEANGVCASLVPDVFDLDEDDYLHILTPEVPPAREGEVRRAVTSCPKMALRLED